MNQKDTGNKMAVMPVKKLILNMGIPVILSMMMQAAYNIVDSIFAVWNFWSEVLCIFPNSEYRDCS